MKSRFGEIIINDLGGFFNQETLKKIDTRIKQIDVNLLKTNLIIKNHQTTSVINDQVNED